MLFKFLPKRIEGIWLCLLFIGLHFNAQAEGTKQLDPNSTDYSKLMTNNASYGSFAQYDGSSNSRLFIHLDNPNDELVYLGFSCESPKTDPTFLVLDLYGRGRMTEKNSAEKGWIKTSLDLKDLPSGTYFLMSRDIGIAYGVKFFILD